MSQSTSIASGFPAIPMLSEMLQYLPTPDELSRYGTDNDVVEEEEQFFDAREHIYFAFLSLPFEIRYYVYKHIAAFKEGRDIRTSHERYRLNLAQIRSRAAPPILNLMLTCHELYDEIASTLPFITGVSIRHPSMLSAHSSHRVQTTAVGKPSLWHIHPVYRHAKFAYGHWNSSWEGTAKPTIPYCHLLSNVHKWTRVEMYLTVHLNKESEPTDWPQRFTNALTATFDSTQDLHQYISFDQRREQRLSTWFYVEDRALGRHVLTCVLQSGTVIVTKRHETVPDDDTIKTIFRNVSGLG